MAARGREQFGLQAAVAGRDVDLGLQRLGCGVHAGVLKQRGQGSGPALEGLLREVSNGGEFHARLVAVVQGHAAGETQQREQACEACPRRSEPVQRWWNIFVTPT